jgi:hypothetical protein
MEGIGTRVRRHPYERTPYFAMSGLQKEKKQFYGEDIRKISPTPNIIF